MGGGADGVDRAAVTGEQGSAAASPLPRAGGGRGEGAAPRPQPTRLPRRGGINSFAAAGGA